MWLQSLRLRLLKSNNNQLSGMTGMFGPVPILNHAAGQQPRRYLLKGMKFMAEYSNSAIVTVAAGQNVPFTEEANTGKPCIVHREGAGLVTLRGLTNQCRQNSKSPLERILLSPPVDRGGHHGSDLHQW
mgnify:CR=1 FL=1